jgi:iduronate 2-sulfatase
MPQTDSVPEVEQRTLIHGYHAAVSYIDAQIGRVIDALDESGLAKNTIIVLWGDHGWHLGDHGMWCKHTNYEQATRIPLIVVAPGVSPQKSKTTSLVESVDIYPTLCELAGLPTPVGLDGMSLVPVLKDSTAETRPAAIHVYPRGNRIGRAVRTPRYRLVEWKVPGAAPDTAELELYDYQTDPEETKNLAAEKPEVVAELRELLSKEPEAKKQWKAR